MNYIVYCIFYLVCPALEQTGGNSLELYFTDRFLWAHSVTALKVHLEK